jgi:hypothetical protein
MGSPRIAHHARRESRMVDMSRTEFAPLTRTFSPWPRAGRTYSRSMAFPMVNCLRSVGYGAPVAGDMQVVMIRFAVIAPVEE